MRRSEPSSPGSRLPGHNYLPPLPVSNLTVRGCVRLWACHHPLKKPSGDKSWMLRNPSLVNDSFQQERTSIWVSVLIVSSLRHHPGVLDYSISIDSHRTLHQMGGGAAKKKWCWGVPRVESTVCIAHELHLCLPDHLTLQRWNAIFQVA